MHSYITSKTSRQESSQRTTSRQESSQQLHIGEYGTYTRADVAQVCSVCPPCRVVKTSPESSILTQSAARDCLQLISLTPNIHLDVVGRRKALVT
ncbi:hypothetical protein BaRGS_00024240 [Batillaria attramentaria]|uniref:Uncharacterized protein n=1 Tax=Batillaria attramentaria TaxID=370345 RepID=A0ABD0KBM2_9CAEN